MGCGASGNKVGAEAPVQMSKGEAGQQMMQNYAEKEVNFDDLPGEEVMPGMMPQHCSNCEHHAMCQYPYVSCKKCGGECLTYMAMCGDCAEKDGRCCSCGKKLASGAMAASKGAAGPLLIQQHDQREVDFEGLTDETAPTSGMSPNHCVDCESQPMMQWPYVSCKRCGGFDSLSYQAFCNSCASDLNRCCGCEKILVDG
uniref:Uncharacterized protein n=1 Tax=Chromera velia CCMP2878 TaxID=1169474 RepID=A0A0G4GRQ5_9ALVE|eukprot:Cvel_5107.t1-p1 / transcript=Cvel_5107.t1 / gene=Cvel_5107 / organism=Chromera_velia_CCMP2878 / gene_product=hypothetical protein / transcript_product=hypothetical protein / location=Cvel_scaffold233:90325-90918(+) / protein_length=198 / sequence_SO=supercontig / SO=protein_coding / is_pseudo=false